MREERLEEYNTRYIYTYIYDLGRDVWTPRRLRLWRYIFLYGPVYARAYVIVLKIQGIYRFMSIPIGITIRRPPSIFLFASFTTTKDQK